MTTLGKATRKLYELENEYILRIKDLIIQVNKSEDYIRPEFSPSRLIIRMDTGKYTTFYRPSPDLYKTVEYCLEKGLIEVSDYLDIYNTNLLHFAVICDDVKLAKLLLHYGANVGTFNCQKISVLNPMIIKSKEMRRVIYAIPLSHTILCFETLNEKKWLYDRQIASIFKTFIY